MTVMAQMHYLLQPKQDEPPQQPDALAAPEEAGTAEWPHSWQFDEWDAVNRSMAVKVPEGSEDQSWSTNPAADQEIQETMEKWEDMSDEDKAEFVKKVSEAHYAEEQTKEAQV
uniref:Uncharacterized protein n=1 Tax=Lotharella oceanica TaxID=641309 RepID=A0A7S2TKC5_9EUKA